MLDFPVRFGLPEEQSPPNISEYSKAGDILFTRSQLMHGLVGLSRENVEKHCLAVGK